MKSQRPPCVSTVSKPGSALELPHSSSYRRRGSFVRCRNSASMSAGEYPLLPCHSTPCVSHTIPGPCSTDGMFLSLRTQTWEPQCCILLQYMLAYRTHPELDIRLCGRSWNNISPVTAKYHKTRCNPICPSGRF